jgi:hypothetical protein
MRPAFLDCTAAGRRSASRVQARREHQHLAHSAQCTAHSAQGTAHRAQGTAHSAQRTTHNAQRTTHSAQRTTHSAQRTTHSAQRTADPQVLTSLGVSGLWLVVPQILKQIISSGFFSRPQTFIQRLHAAWTDGSVAAGAATGSRSSRLPSAQGLSGRGPHRASPHLVERLCRALPCSGAGALATGEGDGDVQRHAQARHSDGEDH